MNDLIYDAYSIFYQILQLVAPDYLGEPEFLLIDVYIFRAVYTPCAVCHIQNRV